MEPKEDFAGGLCWSIATRAAEVEGAAESGDNLGRMSGEVLDGREEGPGRDSSWVYVTVQRRRSGRTRQIAVDVILVPSSLLGEEGY